MRKGLIVLIMFLSTQACAVPIVRTHVSYECTESESFEVAATFTKCVLEQEDQMQVFLNGIEKVKQVTGVTRDLEAYIIFMYLADESPKYLMSEAEYDKLDRIGDLCNEKDYKAKMCENKTYDRKVVNYDNLPENDSYYTFTLCSETTIQEEIDLCNKE